MPARHHRRESVAGLGRAAADDRDRPPLLDELDGPADEVIGTLVGIAFLEQHAPELQLPQRRLARKRMQVLRLQTIKRGEGTQQAQFQGLGLHRCAERVVVGWRITTAADGSTGGTGLCVDAGHCPVS